MNALQQQLQPSQHLSLQPRAQYSFLPLASTSNQDNFTIQPQVAPPSPKAIVYGTVTISLLTVTAFLATILFGDSMFKHSLSLSAALQQDHRSTSLDFIMNLISQTLHPNVVIALLLILLIRSKNKLKLFTFFAYYAALAYLCTMLKSLFNDPRPFWIDPPLASTSNINNQQIQHDQQQQQQQPSHTDPLHQLDPQPSTQHITSSTNNTEAPTQLKFISSEASMLFSSQINLVNTQSDSFRRIPSSQSNHPILSDQFQTYPNDFSSTQPELSQHDEHRQPAEQSLQQHFSEQNLHQREEVSELESPRFSILPLDWKCYTEYGNPSGHAFLAVPLSEFLLRNYIFRREFPGSNGNIILPSSISSAHPITFTLSNSGQNSSSASQQSQSIKINFLSTLFISSILFSRIYLGMHSLNQVIFGLALGISASIFYRLFAERKISDILYKFTSLTRKESQQESMTLLLISGILSSLPICLYATKSYLFAQFDSEQSEWATNIKLKCASSFDEPNSFHHKCFFDASIIAITLSITLAFLATSTQQYLTGNYTEKPGMTALLARTSLLFLCTVPTACMHMLPLHAFPYIRYICLFAGMFTTGYLLVSFLPILLRKYHLISLGPPSHNHPKDRCLEYPNLLLHPPSTSYLNLQRN